ncbi:relaxase/mobilization nuclease domain-containing protein [Raoultella ornithinolytica]|uniref:Relaxase n=1 Tax=Salmonella enterica TaxID=28901 RepID=A0A5T2QWM1_SALER|nr:relaxase [Salmonella enterica]EAT4542134.1 relaxase [Salmonella enterica]EBL6422356.1 relaxase [Salmonella enterica subsp. enterica serovar Give]EBT2284861.1 relaxase [Salmonella enterica]ECE4183476.1 relaxase [Salmonella enterica]
MKGMQKIRRGKTFAGVIVYALKPAHHHKQTPFVIGGNITGSAAEELIAEFNITKSLRPDVVKPVWHNALRLPKNEVLTHSEWSKIADNYMLQMGFSATHLRCYILHDDEVGQHIHIIASRIDAISGTLYLGKNENLISTRIIQQLECDYLLTRTKGPEAKASPVSRSRISPTQKPNERTTSKPKKRSRNEAMMEKRTGEIGPKAIIQSALEELLASKFSTTEFVQQLVAQNIMAIPNIAATGKMNGFSFEYGGIAFKASQLGKNYSWSSLQRQIDYQPERDNPYLLALKKSTVSASVALTIPAASEQMPGNSESGIPLPSHNVLPINAIRSTEEVRSISNTVGREAYAYEAVEKPKLKTPTSWTTSTFRWIETIPYISTIVSMLKNLNILFLTRPKKYNNINGMIMVEIAPLIPDTQAKTPSQPKKTPFSM